MGAPHRGTDELSRSSEQPHMALELQSPCHAHGSNVQVRSVWKNSGELRAWNEVPALEIHPGQMS